MGAPGLGVHTPDPLSGTFRPAARRDLVEEVLIVLSLSVLASAVYAVIDLLSAPIAGVVRVTFRQDVKLAPQVVSIVFGLAPVALVLYLTRRNGEGLRTVGLSPDRLAQDAWWGALLALAVGAGGLVVYLVSVRVGLNRFIVPVPPLGYWWTVPILVLGAVRAALLEEVIMVGYLVTRLEQMGWKAGVAVGGSALLRGSYHLYQGWGGFAGNVALGLVFGYGFLRWRRTWPLVAAHFLIDVVAGLAYIAFQGECFFGVCLR